MNRYIYSYWFNPQTGKLQLDCFYKMTSPPLTGDALKVALKINPNLLKEDNSALFQIDLRCRYGGLIGPKVIRTDFELTRQEFEEYLTATVGKK